MRKDKDKKTKESKLETKTKDKAGLECPPGYHVVAVRSVENGFYYDFYHYSYVSDKSYPHNYLGRFKRGRYKNVNKRKFDESLTEKYPHLLNERDRKAITSIVDLLNQYVAGFITLAWATYDENRDWGIFFNHEREDS